MSRYVTINTDVDIDLSDIDDDNLIEEIERRDLDIPGELFDQEEAKYALIKIWELRRVGKDYQKELDDLIYHGLGKII